MHNHNFVYKFYSETDVLIEQMICCLDGPRIGIQYETSFAGTY